MKQPLEELSELIAKFLGIHLGIIKFFFVLGYVIIIMTLCFWGAVALKYLFFR